MSAEIVSKLNPHTRYFRHRLSKCYNSAIGKIKFEMSAHSYVFNNISGAEKDQ